MISPPLKGEGVLLPLQRCEEELLREPRGDSPLGNKDLLLLESRFRFGILLPELLELHPARAPGVDFRLSNASHVRSLQVVSDRFQVLYQSTCNCTFPGSRTTVAETGVEIVGSERSEVSRC